MIVAHLGSGASMCAMRGRPQRREHHGLHRARRPADGHPAGPARSRRRAPPDRGEGDDRGGGHPPALPRRRPEGPLRHLQRHARPARQRRSRRGASRSTTSSYRCGLHAGQLAAALGGLDAFVFTAGIGENSAADPRPHRRAPAPGSAPSSTPPPTRPARSASRRRRAASPSSSSRPTRS